MQELRIHTNVKPEDATAMIICNCGALIVFNALEIKQVNKKIVECEVCKTPILIIDSVFGEGCI